MNDPSINQPQALQLKDLHHIAVPCRDAQASERFYCQVLGFRPLPRPPFDFPGAWLYAGGIQIHLIQTSEDRQFTQRPIDSRAFHLAFRVPDLQQACEQLKLWQIPFIQRVNAGGIAQIFLQDPDGMNIELTVTTAPEFGYGQSPDLAP